MPLPQKYRKPVDDFFAGKITSREMREMIERIDDMQMSFEMTQSISGTETMKIPTIEDFKKIAIDEMQEAFDRAIDSRIIRELQETITKEANNE